MINIKKSDFFSLRKNTLKLKNGAVFELTDEERKDFLKWLGEAILYEEN